MSCHSSRTTFFLLCASLLWVACGDSNPSARRPAANTGPGETPTAADSQVEAEPADADADAKQAPTPPPAPRLADAPVIDLVHNRYRWHLYNPGLHVPIAGEGVRKYVHEYRPSWGDAIQVQGARGRLLSGRSGRLGIPVERAGRYRVGLRFYTENRRQQVTLEVNGKRAGRVARAPGSNPGWQLMWIPDVELQAGDNQLALRVKQRERIRAGGRTHRTYGLWHSLQLVPADDDSQEQAVADADGAADSVAVARAYPALSPADRIAFGGDERPALAGFATMELLLEIPETAWLDVSTGAGQAGARFSVQVQTLTSGPAGEFVELLQHEQTADGWTRHYRSLAAHAGQLVRLRFSIAGTTQGAAWGAPRIALEPATEREFQPVRNLVLLVIDTLRADRLSLYGETRVKTAHLSAAAAAGSAVFLHNQAASPSSPPSHATIQSGTAPRVHGVVGDARTIADGVPLLSLLTKAGGLHAGYVGNNNYAMGRLKKKAGFDLFYEPVFNKQGVDCQPVVERMATYVKERGDERFFLSSLPIEPHVPYRYHEGITDQYFPGPYKKPIGKKPGSKLLSRITAGRLRMDDTRWQQMKALYDGEVHYMDDCFGSFLAVLEETGRRADTAIIVTADHGEGMYEHQHMGHAFGHFAELSNVPFVVLWPPGHAMAGQVQKYETVTGLIDIAPTALSILGLPADARIQGQDMLPVMRRQGPWPARVVAMEFGKSYALRARSWKYMVDYSGRERLYHTAEDPTEQVRLESKAPWVLRYMRENAGFYLAHRTRWRAATWGDVNDHGPGLADHIEPASATRSP